MFISMYIRYRQVDLWTTDNNVVLRSSWNTLALILGIIACFGVSIVANFQELNVLIVHLIGSCLAFNFGSLYLIVQVSTMHRLHKQATSSRLIIPFCRQGYRLHSKICTTIIKSLVLGGVYFS